MRPRLSVIIPNYNEKENISAGCLDLVDGYLSKSKIDYEVLISDDGSTDGSKELVRSYCRAHSNFRLLENAHAGKAAAINSGVKAAKGEIILFTDMDQSTPIDQIEKLFPYYDEGYDVVFGSRGHARKDFAAHRLLMSFAFRVFRQIFLLRHVSDTQCGFKSFKSHVAKEIFPMLSVVKRTKKTTGWNVSAFDVELLFIAEKKGYKLREVDVDWADRDQSTGKSRNYFKESIDMLKQIINVKTNDLKGLYS